MKNWLTGRGPVTEPLDGVQLAINHAISVAMQMQWFGGLPGWESTTPADLYDQARWLLICRREYRDGGRWGGELDR